MLLIIAHHNDAEALRLHKFLLKENRITTYLLTPEALGIDYDISLHLKNDGCHQATVRFYQTDTTIKGDDVQYVINRLNYISPLAWQHSGLAEKQYATSEINAFFPAFIHSLSCPVSNPIHNGTLYGESAFADKWAMYFTKQNIPVHPAFNNATGKWNNLLQNTPAENIVRFMQIGNETISPANQKSSIRMSHVTQATKRRGSHEMNEFIFLHADHHLHLLHVSRTPALSIYGERLTQILYQQTKQCCHDTTNGHTQRAALTTAG